MPGFEFETQMEMMSAGLEQRPAITHFSHPHPLEEISDLPESFSLPVPDAGSTSSTGRPITPAGLADFASKKPAINSRGKSPTRLLIHTTIYLILVHSSSFHCKGCGKPGSGFSYNCKVCSQDYHSLCTLKPLSIFHQSHSHPLVMEFVPAYGGKGFSEWFYSCSVCGLDILLDYSKSMTRPLNLKLPVNQVECYSNQSGPNYGGSGPAGIHRANPAISTTPITAHRSRPVKNPSALVGASQFSPGVAFVNQGDFDSASGAPTCGMNRGIPNTLPIGSYAGKVQTMFPRPNDNCSSTEWK